MVWGGVPSSRQPGVPVKRFGDVAMRQGGTNDVSKIGSLFGVHGDKIIDGRIRCYHNSIGSNDGAIAGFDSCGRAAVNPVYVRAGKDSPVLMLDRAGQPRKILERVELPL